MKNEIILDGYEVYKRRQVEKNLELVIASKYVEKYDEHLWACWLCKDKNDYYLGEYSFDDPRPVFNKYYERLENYSS